jgi:acetyl esterase/lipase
VFLLALVLSGCVSVRMVPFYRAVLSGPIREERMVLYKDTEPVTEGQLAKVKRSSAYKMAERMTLRDGLKEQWDKSAEALAEYLMTTDQSGDRIPPPSLFKDCAIDTVTIDGLPCYFISPSSEQKADTILFYIHGGGFIYEMHPMLWVFADSLVRETGLPICVPMYPIYPTIDPEEIVQWMIGVYRELLARYPESAIIGIGDSAGADFWLSFLQYLSQTEGYAGLRFPEKLILISPAMVVGNDEAIIEEMKMIEPHDSMLAIRMLETLPVLFQFPEGELNFWTAPLYGDFSSFPPMYVFSGTFDIFYHQVKPFVERVRSQGTFIEFYTGVEMMHVWPVIPAIPECEAAFREVVRIITGEGGGNSK